MALVQPAAVFGVLAIIGLTVQVAAQDFPTKPVVIVVPSGPGSGFDLVARVVADPLSKQWKQPVVIENKPGGASVIGTENVVRAAPDGQRLLIAHEGAVVINQLVYKDKLSFNPQTDLRPISIITESPMLVVVKKDSPFKTLGDLVSYAKANPGKLNSATGGNATLLYLELFKRTTGTSITQIDYADAISTLNAVAKGEADTTVAPYVSASGLIQSGLIRAIAVAGTKRSPMLPDVPTTTESGLPGYGVSTWMGLLAPRQTADSIAKNIEAAMRTALQMPETRERLMRLNVDIQDGSSDTLRKVVERDNALWSRLIKEADIHFSP